MTTTEVWKDIPGYEGRYQASTEGRVKVLGHYETHFDPRLGHDITTYRKERILKPGRFNKYGHVSVILGWRTPGRPVHHIVAETFLGPRPEGHVVCHNNGNPTDNRLENLRYGTYSENAADIYRQRGKKYKLSIDDVQEIRRLLKEGTLSQTEIGKMFGVTPNAISGIKRGVNYWWLTDEFSIAISKPTAPST